MRKLLGYTLLFLLSHASAWSQATLNYPQTPKDPVIDRLHGIEVIDPYRWLEDAHDAKVGRWTAAQNALTRDYLNSLPQASWAKRRLEELARRDKYTFQDVPEGSRRFITHKRSEDDHAVIYWQRDPSSPFIELLNPNRWDKGCKLDYAVPSRDGRYVAFGVSVGGNECPELKIIDAEAGVILPDAVHGRKQGWSAGLIAWLPNHTGFYYTALPEPSEVARSEAEYWSAVYFHRLGTTKDEDQLVFSHPTRREYIHSAQVSDDGCWLLLQRTWCLKEELYLQRLDEPEAPLIPLATGFDASYTASFAGDHLIVVTDLNAPNYQAFLVDLEAPQQSQWRPLIPESQDPLLYVRAVAGTFFAEYLHHAYTVVKMFDAAGILHHVLPLQSMGTATVSGLWNKPEVWVDFASFAHPQERYQYDLVANALCSVDPVPMAMDPRRFVVEQVWYPSKDGTFVSMFLVYDPLLRPEGCQPTLLTGYGGFGVPITPEFAEVYTAFLEAGGLLAVPNLRGGGEYGETWHRAGMLDKKQNVFDDFISAAEWLVESGYTKPELLAIRGRSNGGLLVGAVMTQRPDLFRAVLCEVPLLDMVRYHKFGYSNSWSPEYGNADDVSQFQYLLRYSPYHRVVDGIHYPAILVRGAENDARTDALHARKMIAKLQSADPKGLPKLLIIDKNSGHFGGTTISEQIQQRAEALTFMMHQLGMTGPKNLECGSNPASVRPATVGCRFAIANKPVGFGCVQNRTETGRKQWERRWVSSFMWQRA